MRILKEEHCQKDAELKEASDNLIVANKKNNSLAEALSEYELKLKEMKEKEKEEHYQKDAVLKEASDNLIVANKKNNSLTEAQSEYELKLKEMKDRDLALDDNASLLKAGKDELNERLKESENNLVTARSDIQNLESQLASLQMIWIQVKPLLAY